MPREFVWAVDEDGKPCKCYAKPENRGKRNCKHLFHASKGEDVKTFLGKLGYNSKVQEQVDEANKHNMEIPDISIDDLPDYKEAIKALTHPTDYSSREGFSEDIMKMLEKGNYYTGQEMFEGCDVSVIGEEDDPDDPNMTKITMKFIDPDGNEYERSFSIPHVNEEGEYILNGSAYRYIPSLQKNKKGISVTVNGNVFITDENDETLLKINQGESTCKVFYEDKNGKKKWYSKDISLSDVEDYVKGNKDVDLPDEVKKSLDKMNVVAIDRINNEGMNKIKALPPDDINDLTYRGVITYKERVMYSVSKKFRSMNSQYRKSRKNDYPYEFSMDSMNDMIKSDLVNASYMQLSDNINPIAAMSQSQRVSWTGEGESVWSTSDRLPTSLRSTHSSYYNLADPNDVSLGGKIGTSVAIKGHIDPRTHVLVPDDNVITGSDFIPYQRHSDPNRAAMAISQMREACPIIGGEDPKASTKGWDAIKGSKLGKNLNVAYLPEEGVWEDAVVISESTAKSFATVQTKQYQVRDLPSGIKPGMKVDAGAKLGSMSVKYPGTIKSVDNGKVIVETVYPMTVGDKMSGRHGNKGVVSKIIPDDKMPKVDGKPADIILSPIGVNGRANLGQIYEVNDGDFNKTRDIEYKGRHVTGTGGTQFMMRINQIAEKKLITNSNKMDREKEYRSRSGEMESILLSTNEDRLEILDYIRHQETSDAENKLMSTLHAIGVDLKET